MLELQTCLSICSKVLERIMFNTMFTYFIENNQISENQSGFKPGDSCVNQLLPITHEIFSRFDDNYELEEYSLTIQSKLKKSYLAERLLRKFILKYFSMIFHLV